MIYICKMTLLFIWTIFLFLVLSNTAYAGDIVIATVNGISITKEVLQEGMNRKMPLISVHKSVSEQKIRRLQEQVLNELIEDELLYQVAIKLNLKLSDTELNRRIELMKSAYPSEKVFRRKLAKTGDSYEEWVAKLKRRLLINQVLQQEVIDKVEITEQDLLTYYQENKEKFVIPERLHLRHILISVNPGGMETGWRTGLEKAQRIFERIISGEDFSQIAREQSDDTTSRDQGGDLGWLHVGQLIPELDEAARQLKKGEVSQPIRSIYGYHLLKLEGREKSKQMSFEEIDNKQLKEKLQKKRTDELKAKFLLELRARANIQILGK